MHIHKLIRDYGLDIAALVEVGAINQAPTLLR